MATSAKWTVIMADQKVGRHDGGSLSYTINDDSFWNQAHFSNIWAIQFGTTPSSDEVEYKDGTTHSAYDASVLGNFNEFKTRFDAAHLSQLQADWDANGANLTDEAGNPISETEAEKISRIGARPTSYSSL